MIFFGHLGFSSLGTDMLRKFSSRGADFRWRYILLFAILPDLIDKPLKFLVPIFEANRAIGHSLLGLCLLWLITRWRKWSPTYVLAYAIHFICDSQWQHLPSLLWPLLGFHIYPPEILTTAEYFNKLISPLNLMWEGLGVLCLIYLFKIRKETL